MSIVQLLLLIQGALLVSRPFIYSLPTLQQHKIHFSNFSPATQSNFPLQPVGYPCHGFMGSSLSCMNDLHCIILNPIPNMSDQAGICRQPCIPLIGGRNGTGVIVGVSGVNASIAGKCECERLSSAKVILRRRQMIHLDFSNNVNLEERPSPQPSSPEPLTSSSAENIGYCVLNA